MTAVQGITASSAHSTNLPITQVHVGAGKFVSRGNARNASLDSFVTPPTSPQPAPAAARCGVTPTKTASTSSNLRPVAQPAMTAQVNLGTTPRTSSDASVPRAEKLSAIAAEAVQPPHHAVHALGVVHNHGHPRSRNAEPEMAPERLPGQAISRCVRDGHKAPEDVANLQKRRRCASRDETAAERAAVAGVDQAKPLQVDMVQVLLAIQNGQLSHADQVLVAQALQGSEARLHHDS